MIKLAKLFAQFRMLGELADKIESLFRSLAPYRFGLGAARETGATTCA